MGKWELIIALAIFAVNGVLGYLAKREKDKARRQAEVEAAGGPAAPQQPQVRVDPQPTRTAPRGTPPPVPGRTAKVRTKRPPTARPSNVAKVPAKSRPQAPMAKRPPAPPPSPTQPAVKVKDPSPAAAPTLQASAKATPQTSPKASSRPSPVIQSPAERMRLVARDPRALQSAFIWAEVLGRPRGLDPVGQTPA